MYDYHVPLGVHPPESPRAIVLSGRSLVPGQRNLIRLLTFFGVPWKLATSDDLTGALPVQDGARAFCILASAECMSRTLRSVQSSDGTLPSWLMEADSVYIYGFCDTDRCKGLLKFLTGDAHARIHGLNGQTVMSVTNSFDEMCGAMSGMRVAIQTREDDAACELAYPAGRFQSIIKSNAGEIFFRVECRGAHFYLNMCPRVIDITSPSVRPFDVKEFFCESVPVAMFLKWAFRQVCWRSAETSACLIIDDPPLKTRYGFLHFQETLKLMDRFKFTTSIAFIPWNWQRTDGDTVRLFRDHPDKLSLGVHGCDHTASEFATGSITVLNSRTKTARKRMDGLQRRTSLQYDRVMVFPQGAFSPQIGPALKLNGFIAAVNTEVAPSDRDRNETTIADLWEMAIMRYGMFPVFTRRYITQGIENFAFDALVGKPCLIAGHHDVFKGHGEQLAGFISKLNSLRWNLQWRSLGESISHSFLTRSLADGTTWIRMFAGDLAVENRTSDPRDVIFAKQEHDPDCVKAVMANQMLVDSSWDQRELWFKAVLPPKTVTRIRVTYFDKLGGGPSGEGIAYRIETRARRYLSEFRDNYLSKSDLLYHSALGIKQFLVGSKNH